MVADEKDRKERDAKIQSLRKMTESVPQHIPSDVEAGALMKRIADITPTGPIEKFRARSIQRKAKMQVFGEAVEAQINIVRDRIQAGEKIAKEQIAVNLNSALEDIKQEHLRNIGERDQETAERRIKLLMDVGQKIINLEYEILEMNISDEYKGELLAAAKSQFYKLKDKILDGDD